MERSTSRAVTALLIAIISIPLSTQAIFRSQDQDGKKFESIGDIRRTVYEYQSGERQLLRRAYSRAIEAYRDQLRNGNASAVKPDINDPSTFKEFLLEEEVPVSDHGAASSVAAPKDTKGAVSSLDAANLSSRQRNLLRSYTRAGSCPVTMEKVLPGFHALCMGIVGDDARQSLPRGIDNDLKAIRPRSSLPETLNSRIKMIEQARSGSKRSDAPAPLRPTKP